MADTTTEETPEQVAPELEQTTEPTDVPIEQTEQESTEQPAEEPKDQNGTEDANKPEAEKAEDDDEEDDEDKRKLFVGGLSWETTQNSLRDFMTQFGEVEKSTVKMDSKTGRSRCFGFVIFKEEASLKKALENTPHKVDRREIDSKKAQPQRKDGKLFVGGVKPETTEETIKQYFTKFGKIEKFERPYDQKQDRPKPFCFITFAKDGPLGKVIVDKYHELDGKQVECKTAEPPSHGQGGPRGRGRGMGGNMGQWGSGFNNFGGPGGGYQGGYGPGGYGPGGYGPYGGGGFDPYSGFGNYGGNQGYGMGGYGFGGGGGAYGFGGGQQSNFGKSGRNRGGGNSFKPY